MVRNMAKQKPEGSEPAKKRAKGGPQPGSGRPPKDAGGISEIHAVRLPPDVSAWIRESGLPKAEAITQAVRTSPAYRIWQGERKPSQ